MTSAQVVNLCFHGIGTPARELEPNEERYWVEPAQFDELLRAIRRKGGMRITFDDGNASDAAVALPALLQEGLTATFFIIAGRLGERGSLSSDDVREVAAAGMTVGSHGMRHRPWRSLDESALREELADATEAISEAAGRHVDQAACPFGEYDRRVLAALRRHGFSRVYTVDGGRARAQSWLQSRHTMLRSDTPDSIERFGDTSFGATTVRSAKSVLKRWR